MYGYDSATDYVVAYVPGIYADTGYPPAPHLLLFYGEHRADYPAPNLGG